MWFSGSVVPLTFIYTHLLANWTAVTSLVSQTKSLLCLIFPLFLSSHHINLDDCYLISLDNVWLALPNTAQTYYISYKVKTRRSSNVVGMLVQRLRRWTNIITASGQCVVFSGKLNTINRQSFINAAWTSGCLAADRASPGFVWVTSLVDYANIDTGGLFSMASTWYSLIQDTTCQPLISTILK